MTATWRYWRGELGDGSRITINVGATQDRSTVSVNHRDLADATDAKGWRCFWKSWLAELREALNSQVSQKLQS